MGAGGRGTVARRTAGRVDPGPEPSGRSVPSRLEPRFRYRAGAALREGPQIDIRGDGTRHADRPGDPVELHLPPSSSTDRDGDSFVVDRSPKGGADRPVNPFP